jgi:hypothetical protein
MDGRSRCPLFAAGALRFDTPPECIHKVDDLGRLALAWRFDLLALLLFLQQFLHRGLVLVLKQSRGPKRGKPNSSSET